jgi:hypothetical protein
MIKEAAETALQQGTLMSFAELIERRCTSVMTYGAVCATKRHRQMLHFPCLWLVTEESHQYRMAGTAELQASIMTEGSAEPLTMVGEAAAREAERKPPMELPTTMTGRRTTSVTNSHKKSSHSVCEYARAGFSARPKPGSVGAYTCTAARRNLSQKTGGDTSSIHHFLCLKWHLERRPVGLQALGSLLKSLLLRISH